MKWNEELQAQSDLPLLPGLVIVLDIDKFENYVQSRGLDPYKPNIVSGELTRLIEKFVWDYRGIVVYGLSSERGTEEVIIEIPFGHEELDSIIKDLNEIRESIRRHGATLSIAIVKDFVVCKPARDRRGAYYGTPGRARATKLLRSIKRRGGNGIIVVS